MEQNNTPNPGKGMGTGGFIISLVALVVGIVMYFIAVASAALTGGGMGLAIGWTVLSVAGLVLSIMGMNKSKAAGHKPGLAIGGLVCGILAVLLCASMMYAVHTAAELHGAVGGALDALQNMGDSLKNALDTMH